jgi:hypothetical protein
MVIVVDVGDEPSFFQIDKCLLVYNEQMYFVCQELQIKHYDYHMHAYAVQQGVKMHVINHRSLKHYKPLSVHRLFDTDSNLVVFG